jgi:hypothetical protein
MKSFYKKGLRSLIYSGVVALLIFAVPVAFYSCYPGEIDSVEEADMVVTLFDKEADFSAYKTYAMPDTIIHICDALSEDQGNCPSELKRTYDNLILDQVEDNLVKMGFTETDTANADVFVVVAANATDMYGYSYYGWYWDYWYGWGGGWYYPPTTVYYEFTTGTLLINMFEKPDRNQQQQINAVWVAAINGLIGEGGNPQARLTTTINQAFDQSAYLGAGK